MRPLQNTPFVPFRHQAKNLILEILNVFLWLKFLPCLNVNEIEPLSRVSLIRMAERVGFEPTCPVIHRTNRFRVDPVTATSVPLHDGIPYLLFLKKSRINTRHSSAIIPGMTSILWFNLWSPARL